MPFTKQQSLIIRDYKKYQQATGREYNFLKLYLTERGFRYSVWLRLAGMSGLLGIVPKLVLHHLQSKFGIQIHSCTEIGGGLYLGHGVGIIIHPKTKIGENFSISQFWTIGSNNGTPAIIEDNVYLGPNVCIVEDVRIGNHSVIGAGSIVTKDIPPYSVAAGVPARVIKTIEK